MHCVPYLSWGVHYMDGCLWYCCDTGPGPPVGTNISQCGKSVPLGPWLDTSWAPWTQGPLVNWITRMLLMSEELAKEQCWPRPSASITNPLLPLSPSTLTGLKETRAKPCSTKLGQKNTMYVKCANGFRASKIYKTSRQKGLWLSCNQYATVLLALKWRFSQLKNSGLYFSSVHGLLFVSQERDPYFFCWVCLWCNSFKRLI